MTGPPPVTRIACTRSAFVWASLISDAPYRDGAGDSGLVAPTTLRWVSMPSFLCESLPTGQYTS